MPRILVLLLAVASAVVGSACGDDDRLVVLTASSLTDVTQALVEAAGLDAAVSAAGSQVLAAQLRTGAPADVLLVADPDLADALAQEGLAAPPVVVAHTSLAIVVRADRVDAITGPADLARQELRLVLADASVPLGRYTRDALRELEAAAEVPAGTTDAVLAGADSLEDAARSVLTKVSTGEAEAGVVFAADERLAPQLRFLPWPADVDVQYTAQVAAGSQRPDDAVTFATFLTTDRAAAVWRRFGFRPAP